MKNRLGTNKAWLISAFGVIVSVGMIWTLYALTSRPLIRAMYMDRSSEFLNSIMEGRDFTSLGEYYKAADRLMQDATLWFFALLGASFLVKTAGLLKTGVLVCSLFAFSFFIFVVFEFFPSLVPLLFNFEKPSPFFPLRW